MRKSLDQTESALKDLSSLHAAIINYSPSGILSIDREGRVILMNRMAETILGQNLIGKSLAVGPFAELFNRADR
jgi:PAS domain S-box-containing protein